MGRAVKKRAHVMSTGAYFVVADIIRKFDDPDLKQKVADHFGTHFNMRSRRFDPALWERATGGKVAPNSAAK